ncbi:MULTISPECIES: UbiA family prenyltransferase [unclassified Bradyrhizobium]|uniref:UbiA family prenyltransferase n=1 Tax=unclassified Bradyrhizobium TaxID=2631580 RepID=UPI00247A3B27|nr:MULTISPECIES: UbiA family prenyltransferase [unclassified Bradyrhizobium]WGR71489.1 UbiA family prenyltransferase [Bradyrhizobium sp. ISRA426]WGR76324.1 UbiA family prenyltransferase [Bradyrhizobium sp. ISRA430]WGR86729.1 UbiA family prenyltransferase [Bradyrhizobium sp. ISRA432]
MAGPSVTPAPARTLVIDLEGALLRSELAYEALFADVGGSLARLRAKGSLSPAALGDVLARAEIDYGHLPYDADVLNQALAARARGEKIYLVAGRLAHHAGGIAAHLGFDGVVAPADLASGAVPFDRASIERISDRASRRASLKTSSLKTWTKALRVYQYAKNTLVFVPAITAHQMNFATLSYALLAFLAFSACASGAYLMNDLLDLAADRQHPTKRHRALAAGDLPISSALLAIPALWGFAVAASLCISAVFLGVLGAYLATTIAYSLVLKRKMLVDVVTLAGLYSLRIIAGAVGVGVVLSEWLLIFSLFVFTSLALIKRFSELSMRQGAGLADPSNRDYRITDLHVIAAMAAASAMNAVTVFSLYVSSSAVTPLYSRPWMLWLLNPLLLYWFGRALMMAHRREMPDDPIIYTFRDGASRITVAAMICIMLAAI